MTISTLTEDLVRDFDKQGINRVSVRDINDFPPRVREAIGRASALGQDISRVIVTANAGDGLWDKIGNFETQHPVDQFSVAVTSQVIADRLSDWNNEILYPGGEMIPLQQIGAACGWANPSRLGISIDSRLGTWFAFRSITVTTCPLPASDFLPAADVCTDCAAPCTQACPVHAPGEIGRFDLDACVAYRLQNASPCGERCLARLACPVGTGHRYREDTLRYFYRRSLDSLRAWQETKE